VIVEADSGELAVFTDMTGQLVFMSKNGFATCQRRMKTPQKCRLKIPQVG
jgi:hypothetical protein